ncbi:hypothetical protein SAMN04490248_11784 [Salinihabitans flavidus]|uniref:Uncharacterized protein n=1 Tax=Salinihabitans flavidus TaxID=569882 RepID=A0A1H8U0I8_9RHOB|nr:DUF6338 family protein [Salinihabitans flavidus]SEO96566.1 hypothetical protein SAMN04490248_11784 [Salinihabitans flavidus]
MQNLLSPDTFEFAARYLLAGYVVIIIRSRFILGVRPKSSELVVEAIVLSLVNQLFLIFVAPLFAYILLTLQNYGFTVSVPDKALLFLEVIVSPAAIGLLLGWNLSHGWNNAILRRLSMPIVHPVQRAHDYAFGNDRQPCLVIVTFEDGTVIRGYFGESSLAASDSNRSDIYLERLYNEDESGQWTKPQPGRSGLVSLSSVRSIEFLDDAGETNDKR